MTTEIFAAKPTPSSFLFEKNIVSPKTFTKKLLWDCFYQNLWFLDKVTQGIDGSAHKPTLIQDTGYMVEKTYFDIAPYLGAFGAYLMPQ